MDWQFQVSQFVMIMMLENAGSCHLGYNNFEELTQHNDYENLTVVHNL